MTTKQFNKLPRAEKAVLVAKDVLLQIKNKKYIPLSGYYIRQPKEINYNPNPNDQINKKFDNIPSCQVCALGSMLMSCAHLGNSLKFEDIDIYEANIRSINNDNVKNLFNSIFDAVTLTMIETAFEANYHYCDNFGRDVLKTTLNHKKINSCISFNKKYSNPDRVLKAICRNIIKNKGIFIPN